MKSALILILLFLILPLNTAFAFEPLINARVDKDSITVGDIIEYSVIVKSEKNVKFTFPEKSLSIGEFELIDFSKSDLKEENNILTIEYKYKISIYKTGEFIIPPAGLEYNDGHIQKKNSGKGIKINVKTVLPEKAGDIKDLKGPAAFKNPLPYYLLYALLFLILLSLLLFLLRDKIFKRFLSKNGKELPPEPLLPPEEEAHKNLDSLVSSNLFGDGEIKEFYTKLSDIIRRYMERRFDILTFERTTDEILEQLNREDHLDDVRIVLLDCDMVKFAKMEPTVNQSNGHILKTRNFVDNTTPVKEKDAREELKEKEGVD